MAAPPPFALAPALVNDGVIDYSDSRGAKLFHEAVKSLSEEGFNLQADGLIPFLAKIKIRSNRCGWSNIMVIPEDAIADPLANLHDLLEAYGELTLDQIIMHAGTYVANQDRQVQNSMQLFHCLTN